MRYQHRDGAAVTARVISVGPVRDDAPIDDDGTFAVDEGREDFAEVHERLLDAGHEPLEGDGGAQDGGVETARELALSELTEQAIVEELDYDELQSIATQFDDVDGSASTEALQEALIEKLREEQEGDA